MHFIHLKGHGLNIVIKCQMACYKKYERKVNAFRLMTLNEEKKM